MFDVGPGCLVSIVSPLGTVLPPPPMFCPAVASLMFMFWTGRSKSELVVRAGPPMELVELVEQELSN